MGRDTGDGPRAVATIVSTTVRVERTERGRWEVAAPDRDRIICDTLDDARRAAYVSAARVAACQLIVQDAYHRVLSREFISGDPEALNLDQEAEPRRAARRKTTRNRLE